jgi:hypothetical protein
MYQIQHVQLKQVVLNFYILQLIDGRYLKLFLVLQEYFQYQLILDIFDLKIWDG